MTGHDRHRYRVHGIRVDADRKLSGWAEAAPDDLGRSWSLSLDLGSPRLRAEVGAGRASTSWQWTDHDQGTELVLHGGGDLGVIRIAVDRHRRKLVVEHTRQDALDGCIDMLTRWVLPDIARDERTALPLHAAALEVGGRAVLVCGASGRGKSSVAAGLLGAGARLVSDEPCCVFPVDRGAVLPPGRRVLRVNADTVAALGHGTLRGAATTDAWGKLVVTERGPAPPDLPVRTIVLLGARRTSGPAVELRALPGREALSALFAERYTRAAHPDRIRADFLSATALLAGVEVVEVSLVDDLGRLAEAAVELAGRLS